MTIQRDLNRAGTGGNYAVYYLKETLKDAGWKVLDSGSGEDSGSESTPYRHTASSVSITIDDQNPDSTHMQLTHTGANFNANMVGQYIDITGMSANNNVTNAVISAYVDSDNIRIENATGGTTEATTGSYEIHGDHFTGVAVGATAFFGGSNPDPFTVTLGAGGCWLRLQDPGGNREILFCRHNSDSNTYDAYWCMLYSKAAGFTGGTPDFNTPPDATDEQVVSSSGTKATPVALFATGTTSTLIHIAADDVANSTTGEYGFFLLEIEATNAVSSFCYLDDMSNTATGDTHPLVLGHDDSSLVDTALDDAAVGCAKTFVDDGGASEAWASVEFAMPSSTGGDYNITGKTSKYDSKERPMIVPVIHPTIGGYLGISRWFRWAGVVRDYPNTGDSLGLLYVDDVVIVDLWDGSTTPSSI